MKNRFLVGEHIKCNCLPNCTLCGAIKEIRMEGYILECNGAYIRHERAIKVEGICNKCLERKLMGDKR